jgi:hypothetical protein
VKLAYTIPEAAELCSVSETSLKDAIDRRELTKRYPSSRPVVLTSELQRWLESLPTEKSARR